MPSTSSTEQNDSTPVMRLRGIRKTLGDAQILHGIDLDVPEGQVLAIMGPSGGGKSTLLRCMNLLGAPDEGSVQLDGNELTTCSPAELSEYRSRIGMVFQQFNLFPHLTAGDNVSLAPKYVLDVGDDASRARAVAALERVGLSDKVDAYPRHLSGGQQQRVAIARSLAMEPRLMLFDEPTSALDAEMVSEVLQVMKDVVRDGMTMIVVSHEVGFARSAADRIVFLADGVIVEDSEPEAFFSSPREARSKQFIQRIL